MSEIVFFLEESSAKEMLEGIFYRIFPPDVTPKYIVFEGKQDLEKRLIQRLRGYLVPNAKFVILRDQDRDNCIELKNKLRQLCIESNKTDFLIRIACHEIESWYLGDLEAVESGLEIEGIAKNQERGIYRFPDNYPNPSKTLEKLTDGKYQKISGSRAIGPRLNLENVRSKSFHAFINGLKKLL